MARLIAADLDAHLEGGRFRHFARFDSWQKLHHDWIASRYNHSEWAYFRLTCRRLHSGCAFA